MISYWQIITNGITPISEFTKECIVNVINPSTAEFNILTTTFGLPEDLISDVLDLDERSRIEFEDDFVFMIMRIPVINNESGIPFNTIPMGVFIKGQNIFVLCQKENQVINGFFNKQMRRKFFPQNKVDLVLYLFLHANNLYHHYLREINAQTNLVEKDLERSIRNKELQGLLKLEKCLVYFTTSLRSNEYILAKLKNSSYIRNNDFSEDLLEDVIIENKQAIEMSNIYSDIQSGMMDAFASVISNNLNIVMKRLTAISILLMIPTLIASLFGMNVPNFMENSNFALIGILLVSVAVSVTGLLIFRKKDWF